MRCAPPGAQYCFRVEGRSSGRRSSLRLQLQGKPDPSDRPSPDVIRARARGVGITGPSRVPSPTATSPKADGASPDGAALTAITSLLHAGYLAYLTPTSGYRANLRRTLILPLRPVGRTRCPAHALRGGVEFLSGRQGPGDTAVGPDQQGVDVHPVRAGGDGVDPSGPRGRGVADLCAADEVQQELTTLTQQARPPGHRSDDVRVGPLQGQLHVRANPGEPDTDADRGRVPGRLRRAARHPAGAGRSWCPPSPCSSAGGSGGRAGCPDRRSCRTVNSRSPTTRSPRCNGERGGTDEIRDGLRPVPDLHGPDGRRPLVLRRAAGRVSALRCPPRR